LAPLLNVVTHWTSRNDVDTAPTIANSTKTIKVVITGKRLTPAEKAQLAAL
jgi:hypothetical protein